MNTDKDINRWQALITQRPEGPWEMSGPHGSSYDRTVNLPISDEMLEELALWLRMGYTPWNGRSMPLSPKDREFMFLLYYSVQGLVARVRAAEQDAAAQAREARDSERKDAWLMLGALCKSAGGTVRVNQAAIMGISPKDAIERVDDPATGDVVFRYVTAP